MTIDKFILEHWNKGKSIDWIVDRVAHNYGLPLNLLVLQYLRTMKGFEDAPGAPLVRDSPALELTDAEREADRVWRESRS